MYDFQAASADDEGDHAGLEENLKKSAPTRPDFEHFSARVWS
jgi:hypothetical protein